MIPCHSAALRCTWPFAVTCMTPSSIENEIAHLTVAAFSSHLSRLRREERLVMTAYGALPPVGHQAGRRRRRGAGCYDRLRSAPQNVRGPTPGFLVSPRVPSAARA